MITYRPRHQLEHLDSSSICLCTLQMQTLFWVNAPKQMKTVTYIFLGWAVLPYAGEMRTALGSAVRLPLSPWLSAQHVCEVAE